MGYKLMVYGLQDSFVDNPLLKTAFCEDLQTAHPDNSPLKDQSRVFESLYTSIHSFISGFKLLHDSGFCDPSLLILRKKWQTHF